MILFRDKKKPKQKNSLQPGMLKLAILLFIGYLMVTDYQDNHQDAVPVAATPAQETALVVNSEEAATLIAQGNDKKPQEVVVKPDIPRDPEVEVETILEGKAESPMAGFGDTVTVKYVGLLADKTEFISTHEVPATFVLGDTSVIPGLEQGISGMREGEIRQVLIPPQLGYIPPFHNDKVPEGSFVAFVVQMADIQQGTGALPKRLALKVLDETEGQGVPAKPGDRLLTHYKLYNAHGMLLAEGEANSFVLGESNAPQDYAEVITGMKVGGKRYAVLPPSVLRDLATGLPKWQMMHLEVELVATGDEAILPEVVQGSDENTAVENPVP